MSAVLVKCSTIKFVLEQLKSTQCGLYIGRDADSVLYGRMDDVSSVSCRSLW